jgi:hypothetical protein
LFVIHTMPSILRRRSSRGACQSTSHCDNHTDAGTDQSRGEATANTRFSVKQHQQQQKQAQRRGRRRPQPVVMANTKHSFRFFSGRSIFGESRCSHNAAPPQREESAEFDIESLDDDNDDDDDDMKVPTVRTKPPPPTQLSPPSPGRSKSDREENTMTTQEMSLGEGIPSVIYIVHDNFLAKVNKRNLLKRIQHSFRRGVPKAQQINDSDEEAYDETLVEL